MRKIDLATLPTMDMTMTLMAMSMPVTGVNYDALDRLFDNYDQDD